MAATSSNSDQDTMDSQMATTTATIKICDFCKKDPSLYTCPRCNRPYCSLSCYQDEVHSTCSEAYYRQCVEQELLARSDSGDPESRRRVQEALIKLHQQNAEDDIAEELDSDDESDDNDLADRLQGVDLNDADAVWSKLSQAERADFKRMISSGQIQDLLPDWKPWWACRPIQEVGNDEDQATIPAVLDNVPPFSVLCKSKPAVCLAFNVANAIAAYVYCMHQFQGDLYQEPMEVANVICSLAGNLLRKENFSSFSYAIAAVAAQAIARNETSDDIVPLLSKDVHCILRNPQFSKASLSDLLRLFEAALQCYKTKKSNPPGTFSRQFGIDTKSRMSSGDLKCVIKKLIFYISWAKELKLSNRSQTDREKHSSNVPEQ